MGNLIYINIISRSYANLSNFNERSI